MSKEHPLEMNALSITAGIIVFKSVLTFVQGMGWWVLDAEKNAVLNGFIDTAFPIMFVWAGVIWSKRNVTPLAKPEDIDGTSLTRADNTPAIKEYAHAQEQAIKIDKRIETTRGL